MDGRTYVCTNVRTKFPLLHRTSVPSGPLRGRCPKRQLDKEDAWVLVERSLRWQERSLHCGTKLSRSRNLIIDFPTSLGVIDQANKWTQRSARAKQAMHSKRMSERCEQMSKWTSEWPSTYVLILGCSEPLWSGWRRKLMRSGEESKEGVKEVETREEGGKVVQ